MPFADCFCALGDRETEPRRTANWKCTRSEVRWRRLALGSHFVVDDERRREIRILRTAEDPVAIALQIEAAPVPEPSLLLALAVGLISFAYVRQRRRVRLLKLQ